MTLTFFDDYGEVPGHHPDHILGLSIAAGAPMCCPSSFLEGRAALSRPRHHAMVGTVDREPGRARANLEHACSHAEAAGAETLVNLFLDENWDAFPIDRRGLRIAHVLHRPGALPGTLGGINATKPGDAVAALRALAKTDPIVVHTTAGLRQASQWIGPDRLFHIGWPAATVDTIHQRFAAARADANSQKDEPYALLIGRGNRYKGIRVLLEAVGLGLPLRVGGKLEVPDDSDWLAQTFPLARVTWEPGWVDSARLDELVAGARVVVFPYLRGFKAHGGASGALVHAMTFAKPIIVSEELRSQVPEMALCEVVPTGDADALRTALERAMADPESVGRPTPELETHLVAHHSYEGHVARLVERLNASAGS